MGAGRQTKRIEDLYQPEQRVGQGQTAMVYAATDRATGERVALKVLHQHHARDKSMRARFVREALAGQRLSSEHAVRVIDVGEMEDGRPAVVMEFLAGTPLNHVLREAAGPLQRERALCIADQIAAALQDAHANGVVHRDLKPENVFLMGAGTHDWVKVVDFGLSKLIGQDEGTQLTRTGMMVGSPVYMAPEQMEGRKDIDHRVDVYALGVLLYEMLAGVSPFAEATTFSSLLHMVAAGAPSLAKHRADLPDRLVDIVARALEPDPAWRIASMESLRSLLAPHWSRAHPLPIPTDSTVRHDARETGQTRPVSPFAATQFADPSRIVDSPSQAPPARNRLPSFADTDERPSRTSWHDGEPFRVPPPPGRRKG